MNRTYSKLALLLLAALPLTMRAGGPETEYRTERDNDVQFRTGFEIEKKLTRRLSASWNEELRLKNDLHDIDRIYSDLGLTVKVKKWLKLSAGYTYIAVLHQGKKKDNYHNYWDSRHRVTAGVTFSYKTPTHWTFSLKERAQVTFFADDDFDKHEKSDPSWALKSKVTAGYACQRVPLEPYVSVELCNTLNAPKLADGNYLDKVRSCVGTSYRINKHHSLNFFYRFDYNLDKKLDVKKSGHLKSLTEAKDYNSIFGIAYKFKF